MPDGGLFGLELLEALMIRNQTRSFESLGSIYNSLKSGYWPLIKSLQTFLLLVTGLTGYMTSKCPIFHLGALFGLTGSLFLSISGSTALNMWFDRDIDACMPRTQQRPLPAGLLKPNQGLRFGLVLSILGIGWALLLDPRYALVVFAGLFFDVIVYTIWLKRRTAWSILWGGVSGGMPVLAGRVLGTGQVDWIGLALAASVLFWIPTHIMTFNMRYFQDYALAGVPTFPSAYGFAITRTTIAISSVLASLTMAISAYGVGMTWGYLRVLGVLSAGLFMLAVRSTVRPSERLNFGLFKYASLYMLSAMLLMIFYVM
jgi:protoheme IX farnesyltransferase